MAKKANHRHDYFLALFERSDASGRVGLYNVCTICGKVKEAPFKMHVTKRSDGSWKWMSTIEDFTSVYGELPILLPKGEE